jgi:hypothetical protein
MFVVRHITQIITIKPLFNHKKNLIKLFIHILFLFPVTIEVCLWGEVNENVVISNVKCVPWCWWSAVSKSENARA